MSDLPASPAGPRNPPERPRPPPAAAAPASAPAPTSSRGAGAAIANALAVGTGALIRITSKIFGQVQKRGGAAIADFRARPEHARWRAYALGSYGLIVAATLAAQLYSSNPINAYVKVQLVEVPKSTMVFVRNDGRREWKGVTLTLNGIYGFYMQELKSGANILVPVTRFGVMDSATGKMTYAPKTVVPQQLSIDCDRGRLDVELTQ